MIGCSVRLGVAGPGPAIVETRFHVIAFADIVDSTLLIELDEEAAFFCIRRVQALLRRSAKALGGRLVDEAGDGALLAFAEAAPAALWAAHCHQALSLWHDRGRFPAMQLRIGIHAGPVLVHGPRVFGRTVSIANFLHELASAGETVVSSLVRERLEGQAVGTLEAMPELQVRCTATRVSAWRIARTGSAPDAMAPMTRRSP